MVATRSALRGLSATDVDHIRTTLAGGRRPKVVFTDAAGQIAGQVGQIVRLTDPTLSDEWLVVRFGRDELPFSPTDLAIPPKVTSPRRGNSFEPSTVAAPSEEAIVPAAPVSARAASRPPTPPVPASTDVATNGRSPATNGRTAPAAKVEPAAPKPAPVADTSAGADPPAVEAKAPARKATKPKPPAALTVTLAYAAGEWTVGATQGSKALAKPYVIKASEALKMVSMLDVPGVQEAVEDIVVAARSQAEQQAERLRAELAELEARLAELRDVG